VAGANPQANESCVVTDRPCGRFFGGSSTCFIATPAPRYVGLELDVIKGVLAEEHVDPYVAVENYQPGRDIFCTKICSKIIEARICVVVLTEPADPNGTRTPNPNVHYEYGLMTAWRKPLIPLQRKEQDLAFNIQSLDTVKYTNENLRQVFAEALQEALALAEAPALADARGGELEYIVDAYMTLVNGAERECYREGPEYRTPFSRYGGWRFVAPLLPGQKPESLVAAAKGLGARMRRLEDGLKGYLDPTIRRAKRPAVLDALSSLLREIVAGDHDTISAKVEQMEDWEIIVIDVAGTADRDLLRRELQAVHGPVCPSVSVVTLEDVKQAVSKS